VVLAMIALQGLLFGALCAYIASVRRLTNLWFWVGLLFGVFALVAVLATPAQEKRQRVAPLPVKIAVVVGMAAASLGSAGYAYGLRATESDEVYTESPYRQNSQSTNSPEAANPPKTMSDEAWVKVLRGYDDPGKSLSQFSDEEVLAASKGVCRGESSSVQTYLASIEDPRYPPGFSRTLFDTASRQRYCS
jgi:hypothetical protein